MDSAGLQADFRSHSSMATGRLRGSFSTDFYLEKINDKKINIYDNVLHAIHIKILSKKSVEVVTVLADADAIYGKVKVFGA